ncbi:hypothetical protein OIB37_03665 [Streptomyces sp. NBC_00820]|uniref:Rv1733c family protein n=1 Tax=Streptomyces sp. NBC_00820 TaxID=2975842 RepID=UPI002ED3C60D|nr:hypothetical protein OIB37_03665 [Streptomyces sp. NBC_00820]
MRSRSPVRGWRWRQNPLRRRSDVVEAWTVLVIAVLLFVAAPLTGVAAGLRAHGHARDQARTQRAERHQVRAVVLGRTDERLPMVRGDREHPYRAEVRWSEPGGGTRTAPARVPAGTRTADVVTVWFDGRGRNVAPPPDDAAVWQHAVTIGVCAAAGAAAVVLLGHAVQRRIALGHRLGEWEREWARTGPRWTQPRT